MDKKQGFFSSLKQEMVRGLSPGRSRGKGTARPENTRQNNPWNCVPHSGPLIPRSVSLKPVGMALSPLREGPDPDGKEVGGSRRNGSGFGHWMKGQLQRSYTVAAVAHNKSDTRLLLGVMGAPLAPVHVSSLDPLPHLSIKDTPIETSSAQYIVQQYTAATGGEKLQNSIQNMYAMGKVRMVASVSETPGRVLKNRSTSNSPESGGFVLWQMNPDMWYVELAVGGSKVRAGCNGKLVWRHTPWLGPHTAKGPVRPLRRALQGLDPRTTASMFADARCMGDRKINGEDCFILKLSADPQTLRARSEGPAEIIRHVLFGYFSQKTGFLVHMEDSHLTRIQSNGGDTTYWETTINSYLDDYKPVEGIMIAHSGRSVATLFRFGEAAMSHTKTRLEEAWSIEEVAFNIPGLSVDCFLPPSDLRRGSVSETCELPQGESGKRAVTLATQRAKIAALGKANDCSHDSRI